MRIFLQSSEQVECISAHYNEEPSQCDLCDLRHATKLLVIKNRAGKNLRVADTCLLEMVRFQVADVMDLSRWVNRLKELKVDFERRQDEQKMAQLEQRKKLERRVIVRKRTEKAGDTTN